SLIAMMGTEGPYVLKIDIQGYEYFALKGAARTLAGSCTIVSEFWPWGLRRAGSSPRDYMRFMKESGYLPFDLDGHDLSDEKVERICTLGERDPFVTTDILFCHEKIP